MTRSEFQSKLIDRLNARVSPGFSVREEHIKKNNNVNRPALILYDEKEEGAALSPVVYVDLFYEAYTRGESFNNIADTAWELLKTEAPPEMKTILDDREYVLRHTVLRLVGRTGNKEALTGIPYREYLDLAVTIGILFIDEPAGEPKAMSVMPQVLLNELNIKEDELFERALENSRKYLGASLRDMHDLILPVKEGDHADHEVDPEHPGTVPAIYVLSNRFFYYGAGTILYSDLIPRLSRTLGRDLLIVPSSIHEVIIMPEQGFGHAEQIREFVYGINRSELRAEDILSDNVYRYSLEKGRIEIA